MSRCGNVVNAAQKHDGEARETRVRAKESAKLLSGEVRHDGISHDGIERSRQRRLHRFEPVLGGHNVVARATQNNLKIAPQRAVVFREQHGGARLRRLLQDCLSGSV